jgi:glyoxylase-like metal-dependent hydrolase (beta-lactamase superfamily II)
MRPSLNRRTALKSLVGGAAGLWLGRGFGSVTDGFDPSQPLTVNRLSPGLAVVAGAGGNVVAARSADSLILVDGGLEVRSQELLTLVLREMAAPRVDALFNTHWHPERTGANRTLGAAGAKIIAHENTRLWLSTEISRPWDEQPFRPLPVAAQPNSTFYTKGELAFGAQPIRYGYLLQSHTDGDMYVFFPEENVLVTGGIISTEAWPLIDWWTGGWILGLVDGLDVLIDVANDDTKIVPGSGPVLSKAQLVAQRDMYLTIYKRLLEMFFAARSPAEAVAANPTEEFNAQWGDPARFVTLAFQSIWGHLSPNA